MQACDCTLRCRRNPWLSMPVQPNSVVARLREQREPLRGNVCPANATAPSTICRAGFYCPNVSAEVVCPAGHYCKPQSVAPWPCAALTSCPEGTGAPPISYVAVIIIIVVVSKRRPLHGALLWAHARVAMVCACPPPVDASKHPHKCRAMHACMQLVGIPLLLAAMSRFERGVLVDADDEAEKKLMSRSAAIKMTFKLLSESRCPWRLHGILTHQACKQAKAPTRGDEMHRVRPAAASRTHAASPSSKQVTCSRARSPARRFVQGLARARQRHEHEVPRLWQRHAAHPHRV